MNVRRLAEAIAGAGHAIDLVTYGFGADVALPPSVRVLRAGRLPFVRRVPIGPSLLKVALDARVLMRAARLLRAEPGRYDAIQGFEEGAWLARALSRVFGVPFVYDMDSDIETQLGESRWFRWLLPLARRIDHAAVRDAIAVLTVCGTLTERVRQLAPGTPVFQIEDAPNVTEFADHRTAREEIARRWRLPAGPLIVYTGNLEPYQGVEILVRAAPVVCRERPDAVFLIVGGDDAQVAALREVAHAVGAAERVVLLGERPEPEMASFLAGRRRARLASQPRYQHATQALCVPDVWPACGGDGPRRAYATTLRRGSRARPAEPYGLGRGDPRRATRSGACGAHRSQCSTAGDGAILAGRLR